MTDKKKVVQIMICNYAALPNVRDPATQYWIMDPPADLKKESNMVLYNSDPSTNGFAATFGAMIINACQQNANELHISIRHKNKWFAQDFVVIKK